MDYKKIIKFSIIFFAIAAITMISSNPRWLPDFYEPRYFSIISLISILLILLPPVIFKNKEPHKQKIILELQGLIAIALLLNYFGELGLFQLYKIGFQYDKLVHFVVPFLMTIQAARFFHIWKEKSFKKSLVLSALTIMGSGFLWEVLEFTSDLLFKTKEWGVYGSYGWPDTIGDVAFNTIGVALGIFTLIFFNRKNQEK